MSQINICDLTFAYPGSYDNIFEHASFTIDTDWRLGLTGRNGRGKTTLLKLLMGDYTYRGSIAAGVDFAYFPYPVADKRLCTRDIAAAVCGEYEEWALLRELSILNVPEEALSRPYCTLSNGEQTKVLLAAMFLKESSFLLIDEPTNHLDTDGRALLSRYLKTKRGFILVSHDRDFLDGCVDHMLAINRADIEVQKGNFSAWWENRERRDSFELAENEKLKGEIKRLEAAARRTANWADKSERDKIGFDPTKKEKNIGRRSYLGEKSRKMMQQTKNIERRQEAAIGEKSALLKNIERAEDLKLHPLAYHTQRLVSLEGVSIRYGEKTACRDVSLTVEQGSRIAVTGPNGCGKSSVLKLVCGEEMDYTGFFQRGSGLKISHVPQDTGFLRGNLRDFAATSGMDLTLFMAVLRKLDFSRTQFEKDMDSFSEGQKKKALIAKSLCEEAHLYVWDEPLNYIDVLSRMQIEELILNFRPTLVFVEHDAAFVRRTATQTVLLG